MKDYNSDSTAALDRFARDKRKRTTTAERIERRPGPRRDADDTSREHAPRRASYNPHFTEDNRPVGERTRRPAGGFRYDEARPAGRYSSRSGGYGEGRGDSEDRPSRPYGRKPFGGPRSGEGHSSDRTGGFGGERSGSDERRPYGRKSFGGPRYGEGRPSDRTAVTTVSARVRMSAARMARSRSAARNSAGNPPMAANPPENSAPSVLTASGARDSGPMKVRRSVTVRSRPEGSGATIAAATSGRGVTRATIPTCRRARCV